MRVISGSKKGHRLKAPKGDKVRPTEDRVKESLFNILGTIRSDAVVLDAFSGTGSIGIEFLSRGAKTCYFTDRSRESIKYIKENVIHTKSEEGAVIKAMAVESFLKRLSPGELKFDYIYIDPPFDRIELIAETMDLIYEKELFKEDTLFMAEYEGELRVDEERYDLIDQRSYGKKFISFYKLMR